jgi:hypothetical protein
MPDEIRVLSVILRDILKIVNTYFEVGPRFAEGSNRTEPAWPRSHPQGQTHLHSPSHEECRFPPTCPAKLLDRQSFSDGGQQSRKPSARHLVRHSLIKRWEFQRRRCEKGNVREILTFFWLGKMR